MIYKIAALALLITIFFVNQKEAELTKKWTICEYDEGNMKVTCERQLNEHCCERPKKIWLQHPEKKVCCEFPSSNGSATMRPGLLGMCRGDKDCPLGQICPYPPSQCVAGCKSRWDCPKGQVCHEPPPQCVAGCVSKCGPDFGNNEAPKEECSGDLVYSDCHSACEPRIHCYATTRPSCPSVCRQGCGCPEDFIRSSENSTTCIDKCKCHMPPSGCPPQRMTDW